MKLSRSRKSGARNVVTGMLKTPDGVSLRFARFAPPAGRRGTVVHSSRPHRMDRKIFRDRSRSAQPRLCRRHPRLARTGPVGSRAQRPPQGPCAAASPNSTPTSKRSCAQVVLPDCPPPLFALAHSMGATSLSAPSHRGQRWFDRIVLSAPMLGIAFMHSMTIAAAVTGECCGWRPGRHVRSRPLHGRARFASRFAGTSLTNDPVRYARNAAVIEAEPALGLGGPTVAWCDAAFRAMLRPCDRRVIPVASASQS